MEKESIHNEDNLLRRVPLADPRYNKPDNTIASFAFKKKKGEDSLSVDVERLTTYESTLLNRAHFCLCKIQTSFVRSLLLDAEHNPLPNNYAHALVKGNITNGCARQMAHKAELVDAQ